MILIIDNFDSFTYNLAQYVGQLGAEPRVVRNNEITVSEILESGAAGIMLSPGPCTPNESGVCLDLLSVYLSDSQGNLPPLFGVCLGHQSIGQVAGGIVKQAAKVMHGKTSQIRHDGRGLFEGMPNPFRAVRYHSLVVVEDSLPPGFEVSARSEDDHEVMGLRHKTLRIEGVQFHPESYLTEDGLRIVGNFVGMTR